MKKESEEDLRIERNSEILHIPEELTPEEKAVWEEVVDMLSTGTYYKKIKSDVELIRQFVRLKVTQNKAWIEFNKNPERYIHIVTGICSDGVTPKVLIKENAHYKTFIECGKMINKLMEDLRLTPKARKTKYS